MRCGPGPLCSFLTGRVVYCVSTHRSLGFSASGRIVFAGYDDGQCIGWDTLLRRPTVALTGHENRVTSLGVAPDGNAVCTGSWDTVLRVRHGLARPP